MSKAISVLIPAYNAGKYIGNCLNSLKNQSFIDFEVVVSNDGSTDSTIEEVEKFKLDNPQMDIKLISNENGGVSMARRRALEVATGDWITFLDADDTLPQTALQSLISEADNNTDLVVGFLNPHKDKIGDLVTTESWQNAVLDGTIPPSVWGKLYSRSLLNSSMLDIPRNITNGEDTLMNIAYVFSMKKAPKFTYDKIYNYSRNEFSLSHSTKRNLDYEYEYDGLRLNAIPSEYQKKFMKSITKFRLNGILGCALSDTDVIARKSHPFFQVVRDGIRESEYRLSIFEWIAMNVKSSIIIKLAGFSRLALISLRYRISSLI